MGHRHDTAAHSREGEGGESRDENPAFHASLSLRQMSGCGSGGEKQEGRESQYKVSC